MVNTSQRDYSITQVEARYRRYSGDARKGTFAFGLNISNIALYDVLAYLVTPLSLPAGDTGPCCGAAQCGAAADCQSALRRGQSQAEVRGADQGGPAAGRGYCDHLQQARALLPPAPED